ncbi:uncharacterized protein FFB20_05458 [Fusarium fujikuroi]|nr:uncharacterized protein FFB20_05458 [Fusarium fujikuroi]SCO19482.1 uncharacterized protein FFE2_14327 [Fusarium fujikuroi]SCO25296.1 uncharacterized protein FFC1_15432 [Fusarium fujikuroi]SCO52516.1 uncharacterized protein FFNC_14332 [Fusarium fujikuroi]SCV60199.1 uncharacterized protein FFFS_14768 [Fusarium fujikuroi]
MAKDKFQLNVHPWREVLLMRATGYPLFIVSMLRTYFAAVAIDKRHAKYNYGFQHKDSDSPGIFAYPQPVSDERYVDYDLARFDNQAHTVESLIYVYLTLGSVDWFPSWILARYRYNPVWANEWTSRFVILAHALVPAVHLAIAIACQVIFAALVEDLDKQPWGPGTPLPPDLPPPPPPPPPRGDYISKNPKEREIDPVVTCVLAFVVLSAIDAFIPWAKLLILRVFPAS